MKKNVASGVVGSTGGSWRRVESGTPNCQFSKKTGTVHKTKLFYAPCAQKRSGGYCIVLRSGEGPWERVPEGVLRRRVPGVMKLGAFLGTSLGKGEPVPWGGGGDGHWCRNGALRMRVRKNTKHKTSQLESRVLLQHFFYGGPLLLIGFL